ncbi:MAG: acyl-CoA dehydrogenase family protein, partial [Thermoanaerobaculia bacterium]
MRDSSLGAFWSEVVAFARAEVLPHILEWDRTAAVPRELWRTLGKKGWLGLPLPSECGGSGASARRTAVALDAFAYGSKDLGIVNSWGCHMAMAGMAIVAGGSVEQHRRYLPHMATGETIASFALTEPEAGSHAAAIRTRAVRAGDGYVLDGEKCFVTNGPIADLFVVIARMEVDGKERPTAFIVERGAPGLVVQPQREKSCIRTSPLCDLRLEHCRVAASQRLGEPGRAFETLVLPALDWDRCVVWAGRLGRLRNILEDSVAYARRRQQFGKPIGQHQAIAFKLADIKVALAAAEQLLSRALSDLDEGRSARVSAAVARLFLGESVMAAAADAAQVYGGYGFYPGNHVERYY